MQELRFIDTTLGQTSALRKRQKTSSCLIWLYSRANTINSTLAVIVALPAPGGVPLVPLSTAKQQKRKSCAFLTQRSDRQAH
jgi:hypothetical protein